MNTLINTILIIFITILAVNECVNAGAMDDSIARHMFARYDRK